MQVVIAGLDPAIHPSSQKALTKKMDARVKPAHDSLCYGWQKSAARLAPEFQGRTPWLKD
jgi:hypothetical protein